MEGYRLCFTPLGKESLAKLDKSVAQDILKKLRWLSDNADGVMHLPLKGVLRGFTSSGWGPGE